MTMLESERSTIMKICGQDYEMVLTTKATKEIAKRYGGLENLGSKLMKAESFELALDEVVWLITLLANQGILIHNIFNKEKPKQLLSVEAVELLTTPLELASYKTAIMETMFKGTKRNIQSESSEGSGSKNGSVE